MINVLAAEIVTAIFLIALLLWLLASLLEVQRSLQWWQSRQILESVEAAEVVRNGLLQESFVLRRNLELLLSHIDHAAGADDEKCLMALEKFHASLKDFSDRLSPAYLEDNFPMAVQHWLEGWQSQVPDLRIQVALPREWSGGSYEHHRFVLMILDALFRLVVIDALDQKPVFTKVELQQRQGIQTLTIDFETANRPMPILSTTAKDLKYLANIFRLVIPGKCQYHCQASTLTWRLQW